LQALLLLLTGTKLNLTLHRRPKDTEIVERVYVGDEDYWGGADLGDNQKAPAGLRLVIESMTLNYDLAWLEEPSDVAKVSGKHELRYYHDAVLYRNNQLRDGILFDVQRESDHVVVA